MRSETTWNRLKSLFHPIPRVSRHFLYLWSLPIHFPLETLLKWKKTKRTTAITERKKCSEKEKRRKREKRREERERGKKREGEKERKRRRLYPPDFLSQSVFGLWINLPWYHRRVVVAFPGGKRNITILWFSSCFWWRQLGKTKFLRDKNTAAFGAKAFLSSSQTWINFCFPKHKYPCEFTSH